MDIEKYLKDRVDHQIDWYSTKASQQKKWYYALRGCEIVAALLVPMFAAFGALWDEFPLEVATTLAAFAVGVSVGLLGLTKAQENWVKYRTTAESLKHHKHRFVMRAAPYTEGDSGEFVNNVEALISDENTNWALYIADVDSGAAKHQGE